MYLYINVCLPLLHRSYCVWACEPWGTLRAEAAGGCRKWRLKKNTSPTTILLRSNVKCIGCCA